MVHAYVRCCASASVAERIRWSLRPALDFDGFITDKLDSTAQLLNTRSMMTWNAQPHDVVLYSTGRLYLSMGLRKPRERVKFGQQCLLEKVTLNTLLVKYKQYSTYVLIFKAPLRP